MIVENIESVKTREVIVVTSKAGSGKEKSDPVRRVTSYWDKDGELLAVRDIWSEENDRA